MDADIEALTKRIEEQRIYGFTTCVVRDRPAIAEDAGQMDREEIDKFVTELGFKPLSDAWIPISVEKAMKIAHIVLRQDKAYGARLIRDPEGRTLAERYLGIFSEPRCFTNGNHVIPDADPALVEGAFSPISDALHDAGVVCIDNKRIGILWVEDED